MKLEEHVVLHGHGLLQAPRVTWQPVVSRDAGFHVQVSLDLDPQNAQQALSKLQPKLRRATIPRDCNAIPAAPARQGPMQETAQDRAGGRMLRQGCSEGARTDAEAGQQGGTRPAAAETSTEYFARMEACSAQPASANGGSPMHC